MRRFAWSLLVVAPVLLAAAQLLSRTPAYAVTPPWPMFQHDAQHTGRSAAVGPTTTALAWDFATSGVPGSPAIGADGTIYLPVGRLNEDAGGALYAINPDGTLQWQTPLPILPSSTAPAIGAGGMIYVHGSGDEGNVVAIEKLLALTPAGVISWTFAFNGGSGITTSDVASAPAVGDDGVIYVGSSDTNLYAINPNGTLKWARTPSLSSIEAAPALSPDGGTVYIVDATTTLYAYATDGVLQWQYQLSDTFMGTTNPQSPSVGADGVIYVGSPDNYLYAINPNGTRKWRFATGAAIKSTPAIGAGGTIYVGSDGLYAVSPSGVQQWKVADALFSSGAPIIDGDGAIYWQSSWTAYAFSASGSEQWRLDVKPFGTGLDATFALGSDGTLYIPTTTFGASGQNGVNAYAPAVPPTATPTGSQTATPTTAPPTATHTPTATHAPTPPGGADGTVFLPMVHRAAPATATPTATHTPTATATATSSPAPSALFGRVLALDGVDDSASAADAATLDIGVGATDDFTVETFFYVPDELNSTGDTLFEKAGAYALFITYRTATPDNIVARIWVTPVDYVTLSYPTHLTVGWHHLAFVFDNEWTDSADRLTIYLDGVLATSADNVEFTPGVRNTAAALVVGAAYVGRLEEARISDSLRYTGAAYTVPGAAFAPDSATRALWHFDEAVGATVFNDASGHANTLTGANGAHTE